MKVTLSPPFFAHPGVLSFRFDDGQIFPFRKEARVFGMMLSYRFARDAHLYLPLFAQPNLENEMRIEIGAVKQALVPEQDVVDSIVFPNRLQAVRIFDWDIGAWRAFRVLLG